MRRLVARVTAGFLLLTVFGCSSRGSSSPAAGASATTTAPTTVRASSVKPGDGYVALGSSFASGFGISVQSTGCGRSSRDYAQLIAQRYRLKLTDATPQGKNPPQMTAISPETKLITVTVGGNDIGYIATAFTCGDPTNVCTEPPNLRLTLSATEDALERMFAKIKAAAPSATVILVTYPRVVGGKNCPALSVTDAEADLVRSMGEQLEQMFLTVVKNADAVLVDPYAAAGDHTACAPASQRWTAGHVAVDGFPYHPTALGHREMANMIIEALGK